jgi:hypothetical protein
MATSTRVDSKDPRILHLEHRNDGYMPKSATPTKAEIHDAKKCSSKFKLFMVTRRSTVNPGEVLKLRVELEQSVLDYPDKAFIIIGFTSYGSDYPRVSFNFRDAKIQPPIDGKFTTYV